MSFRPAIVVPLYNHAGAIGATLAALAVHGVPIWVVDDGSDTATQVALAQAAIGQPLVRTHRLRVNQGKGGAVMAGMRLAHEAGHTHALQVDADGQHDAGDVPRFLELGRAHLQSIVCGRPIYDDSVPRARLYGRYATHVWVWVETLSFEIADSMCGFRLYPLDATIALMDRVRIARRMDFDTEVIVRLVWRGVRVVNLATRVTYPADGVSHFDMVRDNLRISWMHTRLVAGMLVRLPWLLARKLARRVAP